MNALQMMQMMTDIRIWALRVAMTVAAILAGGYVGRSETPIRGESELTAAQISESIRRYNPEFDPAIAEAYIRLADRYGVRGDIAICQAIVETGWFRYEGSAVKPEHHNYCGLGVVTNGVEGNGFDSVDQGVRAHLQHLYAYSCTRALPRREPLVDPRFAMVKRGSATTWEALGGHWAINAEYGELILGVYNRIKKSVL